MKIFIVGGAVRDIFLGNQPKDIDLLVTGATEYDFISEFPCAKRVGSNFPVFLVNGEEYALARTERKIGEGHKGFATTTGNVTLEQDLMRRDLTINAIALCPESGLAIGDPRGFADMGNKKLRHTSSAFAEDPLRVFRVARFAAQLDGFTVDSDTNVLMRGMAKELEELSPDRVWAELVKALGSQSPRRFFEVLYDCDCLDYWFPEVVALIGVPAGPQKGKHLGDADTFDHTMKVVESIDVGISYLRFAGLCHDMGKALSPDPPKHHLHDKEGVALVESLCSRLKAPNKYRQAAVLFCREHIRMHRIQEMRSGKAVRLAMLVNKQFPGGIGAFLQCSVGDGMTEQQMIDIKSRGLSVSKVKLPIKYHGKGKSCADILLQIRCKEWAVLGR